MLASAFSRLLEEAEAEAQTKGIRDINEVERQAEIAAIRRIWREGFVADAIAEHCKHSFYNQRARAMQSGLLTKSDLAKYSATIEPAVTYEYHGWTVGKCGPWSQGPVFLQQLALLKGINGFDKMSPDSPEFVSLTRFPSRHAIFVQFVVAGCLLSSGCMSQIHSVVEAGKLAFADREAYYADPNFVDVPLAALLSDEYNNARRKLIDPRIAAAGLVPGLVPLASSCPEISYWYCRAPTC